MDALRFASLLAELPTERTSLLDNLGRIRQDVGPVTPELSDALADHMNIRRGEVDEVVSFYSFLHVPADAVRVCIGPVCDCLGAKDLLAREREHSDGVVLGVECLGHCDLAPVLTRGAVVEPAVAHQSNGFLVDPDDLRDPPQVAPDELLAALEEAGLTGMGGAGFPTWRKWD